MPIDTQDYRVTTQRYNHAREDKAIRAENALIKTVGNGESTETPRILEALRNIHSSSTLDSANNIGHSAHSKQDLIIRILLLSLVNNIIIGDGLLLDNTREAAGDTNSEANSEAANRGAHTSAESHVSHRHDAVDLLPASPYARSPHSLFSSDGDRNDRTIRSAEHYVAPNNVIDDNKYINALCRARMRTVDGTVVGSGALIVADNLSLHRTKRSPFFLNLVERAEKTVLAEKIFVRSLNRGNDALVGYRTGDISPFVKYALTLNFNLMAGLADGDENCENYRVSLMELAQFNLGLDVYPVNKQLSGSSLRDAISSELKDTVEFQPQGIFVQQKYPSGIQTEKKLAVEYQGTVFFIEETKNGDLVAYPPDAVEDNVPVYFDVKTQKIYFDRDISDSNGVEAYIVSGKSFIALNGKNHELIYDFSHKTYSIQVVKENGDVNNIPVYMNPLSLGWFTGIKNQHAVYNETESAIISALAVPMAANHDYREEYTIDRARDGNGVIYKAVDNTELSMSSSSPVVEMNGKLLPVRARENERYQIFNQRVPDENGYPIEYDGERWVFYKSSSIHASPSLCMSFPETLYARHVDARKLSGPDERGLRWGQGNNAYLKVNDNYIRMRSIDDNRFRVRRNQHFSALKFYNNQFYIESFTARLESLLSKGHPTMRDNPSASQASPADDSNGVLKSLMQLTKVKPAAMARLLHQYGIVETTTELGNWEKVEDIMARLTMRLIASSMTYSELNDIAESVPDGRYFVISRTDEATSGEGDFYAHALEVRNDKIRFLGGEPAHWIEGTDSLTMWGPYSQ